jgi:hypothetical protein
VAELEPQAAAKDCPLSAIDYLWIDRLCDHFKNRTPGHKDGKPIVATTVATTIRRDSSNAELKETKIDGVLGPTS